MTGEIKVVLLETEIRSCASRVIVNDCEVPCVSILIVCSF